MARSPVRDFRALRSGLARHNTSYLCQPMSCARCGPQVTQIVNMLNESRISPAVERSTRAQMRPKCAVGRARFMIAIIYAVYHTHLLSPVPRGHLSGFFRLLPCATSSKQYATLCHRTRRTTVTNWLQSKGGWGWSGYTDSPCKKSEQRKTVTVRLQCPAALLGIVWHSSCYGAHDI